MKTPKLSSLITPETKKIFAALNQNAMFVGGCVRDCLLGNPPQDIDIATPFKPDAIIALLKSAKITAIPTGYKHGTITAVIKGKSFEITTLRRDVATDGRHAVTEFDADYKTDAMRRDFTINALYADNNGTVYDFLGTGLDDLASHRIRFIGNPTDRINEDYLRILRYFRFMGQLDLDLPDKTAIRAIRRAAPFISQLSKERILSEFSKILMADNCIQILRLMRRTKVLQQISPTLTKINNLENLLAFTKCYKLPANFELRLFALCQPGKVPLLYQTLKLSKHSAKTLQNLSLHKKIFKTILNPGVLPSLFLYGKELCLVAFCLGGGVHKDFSCHIKNKQKIKEMLTFSVPQFPVTNKDIMSFGYKGKDIGLQMAKLQKKWLFANCTLPRDKLLAVIKKV